MLKLNHDVKLIYDSSVRAVLLRLML